jgi:hypothetical protein
MGGRLDATNVVRPQVSVITSISCDHMMYLGDTLPATAAHKSLPCRLTVCCSVPCRSLGLPISSAAPARCSWLRRSVPRGSPSAGSRCPRPMASSHECESVV